MEEISRDIDTGVGGRAPSSTGLTSAVVHAVTLDTVKACSALLTTATTVLGVELGVHAETQIRAPRGRSVTAKDTSAVRAEVSVGGARSVALAAVNRRGSEIDASLLGLAPRETGHTGSHAGTRNTVLSSVAAFATGTTVVLIDLSVDAGLGQVAVYRRHRAE